VVTNAHNLRGEIAVTFEDGRVATATVAGADLDGDLAVLRSTPLEARRSAWSTGEVALGEVAIRALAARRREPAGRRRLCDRARHLLQGPWGRTVTGALEHSAPLARGSSGGPVVDSEAVSWGSIPTAPAKGSTWHCRSGTDFKARVDALGRGESPRRVRLGVALAPPKVARKLRHAVGLPERDGLLVHAVEDNGPADRAGIRRGDLIVSVGGQPVTTVEELAVGLTAAGDAGNADLVVVRGVDELSIAVNFEETAPSGQASA